MSAIGDYIHLTKGGYEDPKEKKYGILPYGYSNSMISEKEAINTFQNQKKKIKEAVSLRGNTSTAAQIQKQIRELQGIGESDNSAIKKFYKALINKIEESLNVVLNNSLKATPKTNTPEDLIKKLKDNLKKIYTAQNDLQKSGGSVSIEETLVPFANEVAQLMQELEDNKINTKKVEDLIEKKQRINQYVDNFCKVFNNLNTDIQQVSSGKTRTLFSIRENAIKKNNKMSERGIIIFGTDSGYISVFEFAQIVRALVDDLGYSLNKKQGDAAEIVVAAASAIGYSSASKTVDQVFKEVVDNPNNIWTGKQTSQIFYKDNKDSFAEHIQAEIGDGYTFDKQSGLIVSQLGSQDKVDVKFYLNSTIPPLNTTIKNYKLNTVKKHGFGGVSGSPFLYLAKEMNNNNFVNHWINSTIYHSQAAGSTLNIGTGRHATFAHQIMKYTLVVIGAIGGVNKLYDNNIKQQDMADYLVWNDPTSKEGMRVYAISDILKKAFEDVALNGSGNWSKSYDDNFITKNWSAGKMLLESKSEGKKTIYQQIRRRTQKALLYMHQAKISTKFYLQKKFLPDTKT